MKFKPHDDLMTLAQYATPEQFGRIVRALEEVETLRQRRLKNVIVRATET